MKNRILYITIFMMYASCASYAFFGYDSISNINIESNYGGNFSDQWYNDAQLTNAVEMPIFKFYQIAADEDDWWTNPPTTGEGDGNFVGGLPIGDGIELLFLFCLLYILFKKRIIKM